MKGQWTTEHTVAMTRLYELMGKEDHAITFLPITLATEDQKEDGVIVSIGSPAGQAIAVACDVDFAVAVDLAIKNLREGHHVQHRKESKLLT